MIDGQTFGNLRRIYRAVMAVVERSRFGRAAVAGVRATLRSFGGALHQLWLEVTGFTFLVMAAVGALSGFREYGRFQSGHSSGPARLVLAVCFTASFAWFGLSSFWRVNKRVSKSRTEPR
jgi:hypothetical protein